MSCRYYSVQVRWPSSRCTVVFVKLSVYGFKRLGLAHEWHGCQRIRVLKLPRIIQLNLSALILCCMSQCKCDLQCSLADLVFVHPGICWKKKKKVLIQTENDPNSAESKAWFHGLKVDFLQAFKKRKEGLEMTSYKENKLFYDIICKTKTLWNIVSISILFVPLGQIYWIIITIMRMKKKLIVLTYKGQNISRNCTFEAEQVRL